MKVVDFSGAAIYVTMIIGISLTTGLFVQNSDEIMNEASKVIDEAVAELVTGVEVVSAYGRSSEDLSCITDLFLTVRTSPGCGSVDLTRTMIEVVTCDRLTTYFYDGPLEYSVHSLRDVSGSLSSGVLKKGDLARISLSQNITAGERIDIRFNIYPSGESVSCLLMPDPIVNELSTLK